MFGNTFTVTRMLMCEVGSYNDVFLRPLQADLNSTLLMDRLRDVGEGAHSFNAVALNSVSSEMLRLSSTHQGNVRIDNGLDTRRLVFMMEVVFPGMGGAEQVEWFTGWTDQVGVTERNGRCLFDRNMRLYFNTATSGRRSTVGFGRRSAKVIQTAQLLTGDFNAVDRSFSQNEHLLRPGDVLNNLSAKAVQEIVDFADDGDGHVSAYDLRNNFASSRVMPSFRDNVIPAHYLSRIMRAWDKVSSSAEDISPQTSYSDMAQAASESSLGNSFRTLGFISRASELQAGGRLTWGELCDCDDTGTLEDRVIVNLARSDRTRGLLAVRGEDDNNDGNDHHTSLAMQAAQVVPALMMRYFLTHCAFNASNCEVAGSSEWVIGMGSTASFMEADGSQTDLTDNLRRFMAELSDYVLPGLAYGDTIEVDLDIDVDVMGDCIIEIRLWGERHGRRYRLPSFCDSTFTSVRSRDDEPLRMLGTAFDTVFTNVYADHSVPSSSYDLTSSIMDKYSNGNSGAL